MRKALQIFVIIFMLGEMCSAASASEGVILLHGLCRGTGCMGKMQRTLEREGFAVVNVAYPSRTASIESLGESSIGTAMGSSELRHCSRIHFVTHSLGGILVRSYFKRHSDARLGRVVMLGPPNGGSEIVDRLGSWWLFKAINGPAGMELGTSPESTPNMLGPVNYELGIIAGDRSINWINSLMIRGKDDGKVSVERTKVSGMKDHVTIHATHPYLMKNRRAIAYTIRFLRKGTFGN